MPSWTKLIQFNPIWSNLIQSEPICSSLIQFDPIYSNLIKFDQFDPILPSLIQFILLSSNFIQFYPILSYFNQIINLMQFKAILSDLNFQKWAKDKTLQMTRTLSKRCLSLNTLLTAEIIKWQKCAHMGLNGFHIKCIIGTHCNWKNQNPGSPLGATS